MSKLQLAAAAAGLLALSASPARAEGFALGAGVGTTGLEGALAFSATRYLVVRGSYNWLDFDHDETVDDIRYNGNIGFSSFTAGLDLHPFANAFFVGAGVQFGDRDVDVTAAPATNVTIGDVTYTAAQVGTLRGAIDMGDSAPVVALGFDNTFTGAGPVGVRALIGAAFNDVKVSLTASNPAVNPADLAREAQKIKDDADAVEIYPLASIGLNFRF